MTIRCLLGRHDDLLERDGPRLFLRCQTCGRVTPGLAPNAVGQCTAQDENRILALAHPRPFLERLGRILTPVPFLLLLVGRLDAQPRVWTNADLHRPVTEWQKPPLTPQEAADVLRPHQTVVHVCYDCEGPTVVVFGAGPSLGPWDDAARMGPHWTNPPPSWLWPDLRRPYLPDLWWPNVLSTDGFLPHFPVRTLPLDRLDPLRIRP